MLDRPGRGCLPSLKHVICIWRFLRSVRGQKPSSLKSCCWLVLLAAPTIVQSAPRYRFTCVAEQSHMQYNG